MAETERISLGRFFLVLLRVGSTGFGGPMALISLMQQHLVERRKAVDHDDFAEGVAIGQVLPGPIAIDAAIHVGYRLYGWWGALAGAVGLILPPMLLMLAVTPLYFHYGRVVQAQGFFAGVRPAVAAAVAAATLRLGKKGIRDFRGYVIAAVAFLWMLLRALLEPWVSDLPEGAIARHLHGWSGAICVVIVSGILGAILYRPQPGATAQDDGGANDEEDAS